MSLPDVVTREEWLRARKELLVKEKAMTRARDTLNADRRRLPMVRMTTEYAFEGPSGQVSLLDLFEGRRQLIVQHFMFAPEWDAGCPSCSASADEVGHLAHLHATDTTFAAVSRAPWSKIEPFKRRMGWSFPWYSSFGSTFNYDFHVTFDESVLPLEYNYRTAAEHEEAGTGYYLEGDQPFDLHGMSCFLQDGGEVFHTYSAYGRGCDMLGFTTNYLDLTALGRQEEWEEPKGRGSAGAQAGSPGLRLHDEYDA
jgi:predicted dithiol-disulfide oxidoreductase (DUF899 family)